MFCSKKGWKAASLALSRKGGWAQHWPETVLVLLKLFASRFRHILSGAGKPAFSELQNQIVVIWGSYPNCLNRLSTHQGGPRQKGLYFFWSWWRRPKDRTWETTLPPCFCDWDVVSPCILLGQLIANVLQEGNRSQETRTQALVGPW